MIKIGLQDVSSVVYQCLLLMVSLKLKRYAETAIVMILQMWEMLGSGVFCIAVVKSKFI